MALVAKTSTQMKKNVCSLNAKFNHNSVWIPTQVFFMKCDIDIRKDAYANVVLSSGMNMCQRVCEHRGFCFIHDVFKVVASPRESTRFYFLSQTPPLRASFAHRRCIPIFVVLLFFFFRGVLTRHSCPKTVC